MQSIRSNSEDFRDVIDDLTIQNKKLRKKLKKYETLHCSHLQEEKLFEVRFHGLPAHKKCELDDLLRGFAVSIEDPPAISSLGSSRQQSSSLPDPLPLSYPKETSSSITSNSKPVDSAYASMSNSGQTQIVNSHINDKDTLKETVPAAAAQSKQQKVESYLDDMPRRLIPKHSIGMSDLAKRKLVVRRLEGLFTGKGAASSKHDQPQQQEEVSQSAAKADRTALEAGGRRARVEGLREARIATVDADALAEHMSDASLTSREGTNDGDEPTIRDAHASLDETPDQRPTRPLDLDLYRAQIPADNIQYLRHLGLASPNSKTDAYTNTANGWVYLNLLMNMAQLHAFNVTPEFTRKSVMDLSTKLELSPDGRKIRWKGGAEESILPSDSGDDENGVVLEEGNSGSQRHGTEETNLNRPHHSIATELTAAQCPKAESSANLGGSTKLRPIFIEQVNDASKLFYKPLFYHSSEEGDDYSRENGTIHGNVDSDSSVERAPNTQPSNRNKFTRDTNGENGPIIFYNKANFCTDLSGDIRAGSSNRTMYSLYSSEPVGSVGSVGSKLQYLNNRMENLRGPVTEGYTPSDQMDLDIESQSETESLLIFEGTDSQHDNSSHAVARNMEASGLGGVQPMDHFSINVRVQRKRTSEPSVLAHTTSRNQANHFFRSAPLTVDPVKTPLIKSIIVSVNTRQLRPSSLPPPSYIYPQASLSEISEDSDESEPLSASLSGKRALPSSATDGDSLSIQSVSSLSSFGGSREALPSVSSSPVGSDDSSIDLLAHARELDPETIAAREMEFDRTAGQQLSGELAGNSAAAACSGTSYPSEDATAKEKESKVNQESRSEHKNGLDDFPASLRRYNVERDGNGQDTSSVDVMFTSSGMEESD